MISKIGYDIDGVIAPEPELLNTLYKKDSLTADIAVYIRDYLLPVYHKPTRTDGILITRRPEMDSVSTKFWLRRNKIKYNKIYFAPGLITDEENLVYKVSKIIYENLDIYIESDNDIIEKLKLLLLSSHTCEIINCKEAYRRHLLKDPYK